jgi:hypothetical protein
MALWLVDTAGIGSIIVMVVGIAVLAAYSAMLRWIATTPREALPIATDPEAQERRG